MEQNTQPRPNLVEESDASRSQIAEVIVQKLIQQVLDETTTL
jgi:hypothetical protein